MICPLCGHDIVDITELQHSLVCTKHPLFNAIALLSELMQAKITLNVTLDTVSSVDPALVSRINEFLTSLNRLQEQVP